MDKVTKDYLKQDGRGPEGCKIKPGLEHQIYQDLMDWCVAHIDQAQEREKSLRAELEAQQARRDAVYDEIIHMESNDLLGAAIEIDQIVITLTGLVEAARLRAVRLRNREITIRSTDQTVMVEQRYEQRAKIRAEEDQRRALEQAEEAYQRRRRTQAADPDEWPSTLAEFEALKVKPETLAAREQREEAEKRAAQTQAQQQLQAEAKDWLGDIISK